VEEAPAQAWLLRLRDGRLTGVAGIGVKGGRDWLFEGGWACTDSPRSLSLSGIYLGSGAVWDGRTLSLIAPSHSADAVYILERPGELFASNSLAFLLAGAGFSDFPIATISKALFSLKRGLRSYERRIHSGPQGTLYRYFNAIVRYDRQTGLQERQQKAEVGFQTFEEYRDYLLSVIRQAGESYGSKGIAVFISRGYDSAACAGLAKQLGDATAICVDQSRFGDADDGTEVAKALGMPSVLLSRKQREKVLGDKHAREFVGPEDYAELFEFYIGMTLADECLRAPAELLSGRTVLTGFHGDKIWDRSAKATADLERGDSTGASLGEFRLRVGFLHIPVPMLAFRAHAKIRAINRSPEMEPWRLHTNYDRPIPRRIAEEAGVPRDLFGNKKRAAATLAVNLSEAAPTLFRMLVARYEPAALAMQTTSWRRWLSSFAGRFDRGSRREAA
jgi:hypothetical protein